MSVVIKRSFATLLVGVLCVIAGFGLSACSSSSDSESSSSSNQDSVLDNAWDYLFSPVNEDSDKDAIANLYDTSGGVAVTVNGVEIGENVVTAYIETFRESQGLDDEADWADFIISSGYGSLEELRDPVVEYYESIELIYQAAAECGATVSSEEIDEYINEAKEYYGDDFDEVLAQQGMNEALYRLIIECEYLEDATMEKLADEGELGDVEPSDEDTLEIMQYYASVDGAKRSSNILFDADDRELAQEVLDKINSGELSFEDAAKEYSIDSSSAEEGGDVGWDDLNTFVDSYQEALDELSEGEVSGLVDSDYGIHIIKCTDVLLPLDGEEEITSLDQFSSSDYVQYFRDYVKTSNEQDAFYYTWLPDFEDRAEIVVNNDIDYESLPYYVDLSKYQEEEAAEEESAEDESSEDENNAEDESMGGVGVTTDVNGESADEEYEDETEEEVVVIDALAEDE